MEAERQIARWEQRLLRGKLHLPRFGVTVLTDHGEMDSGEIAGPLCGRQLNNHRSAKAQLADKIEFATSEAEFTYQLMQGKACTHCGVAAGLLVRTVTIREEESEDE